MRLLHQFAVFVVIPAMKQASAEAGRVHSEIYFHAGQGQAALPNQFQQHWRHFLIFQVIENRIVVRNAGDQSPLVRFAEIAHEPAAREAGIDFEGCGEDSIRERERRPSASLPHWLLNASAEIAQQLLKFILLAGLRGVVGWPVLRVRLALHKTHSFRNRGAAVRVLLVNHEVSNGIDVLTGQPAFLKIRAGTIWFFVGRYSDEVPRIGGLRQNHPFVVAITLDFSRFCNRLSAFFSRVHNAPLLRPVYYDWVYILSRKVREVYVLIKYISNNILWALWLRSHCRATSANGANISGFRVKAAQKNQGSVPSASRLTGIARAKVTGKNHGEARFPQPTGLKSKPAKALSGGGSGLRSHVTRLKVACPCPTRRCRHCSGNRVEGRVPNVCLYPVLQPPCLHLQFNKDLLSVSIWELLPMRSGGLQMWSLPLSSVRFPIRSRCATSGALLLRERYRRYSVSSRTKSRKKSEEYVQNPMFSTDFRSYAQNSWQCWSSKQPRIFSRHDIFLACNYLVFSVDWLVNHSHITKNPPFLAGELENVAASAEFGFRQRHWRSDLYAVGIFPLCSDYSVQVPISHFRKVDFLKEIVIDFALQFLGELLKFQDAIALEQRVERLACPADGFNKGVKRRISIEHQLIDQQPVMNVQVWIMIRFNHLSSVNEGIWLGLRPCVKHGCGPFHFQVIGSVSGRWQGKSDLPKYSVGCPINADTAGVFRQSHGLTAY